MLPGLRADWGLARLCSQTPPDPCTRALSGGAVRRLEAASHLRLLNSATPAFHPRVPSCEMRRAVTSKSNTHLPQRELLFGLI